jgi:hypothetical protein
MASEVGTEKPLITIHPTITVDGNGDLHMHVLPIVTREPDPWREIRLRGPYRG